MRQIRIHGRGGQGSVIASKLLASAFFREGLEVQAFPRFGVERRGAPVTAYLRVSDGPIKLRCQITEPDELIVLDPTLVSAVDVTEGLAPGGTILINSSRPPGGYPELLRDYRVATVDAGTIAAGLGLGSPSQPIVNTAILGAFAADSGRLSLETVCETIAEEVPADTEANLRAARRAAAAVRAEARREQEVARG